tara:strand:- start:8817 stop:9602 length:786 start_codon:yes stop_codon:yes gene_type:complete
MDCSKCIFAEVKPPENDGMFGLWQHGCGAGRLTKLKERQEATLSEKSSGIEQHTYYDISRFCNMYRTGKWKENAEGCLKTKAEKESQLKFGMVVNAADRTEQQIKETFDSLLEIDYPKDKFQVTLSIPIGHLHTQILLNEVERVRGKDVECNLIMHANHADKREEETEMFQSVMYGRNNFICKINAGNKIKSNFLSFMDKEVNEKLNKIAVFEDKENQAAFLSFGAVNSMYPDFLDYDLMAKELTTISKDERNYREYEKKK